MNTITKETIHLYLKGPAISLSKAVVAGVLNYDPFMDDLANDQLIRTSKIAQQVYQVAMDACHQEQLKSDIYTPSVVAGIPKIKPLSFSTYTLSFSDFIAWAQNLFGDEIKVDLSKYESLPKKDDKKLNVKREKNLLALIYLLLEKSKDYDYDPEKQKNTTTGTLTRLFKKNGFSMSVGTMKSILKDAYIVGINEKD